MFKNTKIWFKFLFPQLEIMKNKNSYVLYTDKKKQVRKQIMKAKYGV